MTFHISHRHRKCWTLPACQSTQDVIAIWPAQGDLSHDRLSGDRMSEIIQTLPFDRVETRESLSHSSPMHAVTLAGRGRPICPALSSRDVRLMAPVSKMPVTGSFDRILAFRCSSRQVMLVQGYLGSLKLAVNLIQSFRAAKGVGRHWRKNEMSRRSGSETADSIRSNADRESRKVSRQIL